MKNERGASKSGRVGVMAAGSGNPLCNFDQDDHNLTRITLVLVIPLKYTKAFTLSLPGEILNTNVPEMYPFSNL